MERERALEIVRKHYSPDGVDDTLRRALETLIPELTESEDERIRKLLVWQVHLNIEDETNDLAGSIYDGIKGHDPDLEESIEDWKKCLAWLEKQKEHQNNSDAPKEKSVGGNFLSSHKDKNLDEIAQDYVDGVKEYNSEPTWDLMQTAVCYGYHLAEQKPIQPEEEREYVKTLKGLVSDFVRDCGGGITDVGYYQRISDWLDGRHIEQKSDTRTADDLQLLGFIYDLLASLDWRENYAMSKEECLRRLNDYRPQKPAEGREYSCPNCGTSACCDDERFEIIAQAKRDIIVKTNIAENELSMELPLLDGILMRVWQVGWLNKKPAEWGEEDDKMRLEAIRVLESGCERYIKESGCLPSWHIVITWLKSLPLNLKKKNEDVAKLCSNEWSEEDEKLLDKIEAMLDSYCDYLEAESYYYIPEVRETISQLKSLRPQKLDASKLENFDPVEVLHRIKKEWPMAWEKVVPTQEWSDEDEKTIDDAYCWLCEYAGSLMQKNSGKSSKLYQIAKKLKFLNPQPRKEIYQAAKHDLAIKFMNYLDENRPEGKMSLSNGECEDIDKAFRENNWAKILRYAYYNWKPSDVCYGAKGDSDPAGVWKPSEEQMEALKSAVKLYKDTHYEIYHERIVSLYEQLKKLM